MLSQCGRTLQWRDRCSVQFGSTAAPPNDRAPCAVPQCLVIVGDAFRTQHFAIICFQGGPRN